VTTIERAYGDATYGSSYYGYGPPPDARPVFVVDVLTAAGWQDITCDVRAIDVDRGRSTYYEAFKAGTCTITLADFQDRYSAWNPSGILAGAGRYLSNVPVRVRVITPTGVSSLFTGTTDAVVSSWPYVVDAQTVWNASDAFKQLSRWTGQPVTAVGAGELAGARVARILAAAGYTGATAIDAGKVTVAATDLSGIALDQLRKVGETEWGWLFMDVNGTLVFRQRDAFQTDPRMVNVQWTFTDGHDIAGACYADIQLRASDDEIYNVAVVGRVGGAPQTAQDAGSVAWFGPRTWTRTDLAFAADADALALAQLVVLEYAKSDRRVQAVTFDAMHPSDPAYAVAAGIRINDRIRAVRRTPGGTGIDAELLVQGLHHVIAVDGTGYPSSWTVTAQTADAALVRLFGEWDQGQWDTDQWGV
jgi:hypothetical protein